MMNSTSMNDLQRLRIDHIGSLVRPAKLKEAFARYDRGRLSREQLGLTQDEAIREVIAGQEAHGFPVVTDGEFRRHSFQESFSEAVSGFDVPKNIGVYYEQRQLNQNPLERAEQNFDETGPAIVTRRPAVERLKLVEKYSSGRVSLRSKCRKETSESDPHRPRSRGAALQVGSFHGRVQGPR